VPLREFGIDVPILMLEVDKSQRLNSGNKNSSKLMPLLERMVREFSALVNAIFLKADTLKTIISILTKMTY
jgi:hypothetical protein